MQKYEVVGENSPVHYRPVGAVVDGDGPYANGIEFYLASEVDARIAELDDKLVSAEKRIAELEAALQRSKDMTDADIASISIS